MTDRPLTALQGRIVAVCRSAEKGVPKENVHHAFLLSEWGVQGDAHAGTWHRQVSLLGLESIEKMRQRGLELKPGDFAENITTEGIELFRLPVGTRLRAGNEVVLEVTQIGKRCHTGCAIFQKVGNCIMPLEGIFAKVIQGGVVQEGDLITVQDLPEGP